MNSNGLTWIVHGTTHANISIIYASEQAFVGCGVPSDSSLMCPTLILMISNKTPITIAKRGSVYTHYSHDNPLNIIAQPSSQVNVTSAQMDLV